MKNVTTPPRTSRTDGRAPLGDLEVAVQARPASGRRLSAHGVDPTRTGSPVGMHPERVDPRARASRLGLVDLRDEQPKKHEIGNRTYIVADVEPLDVDGVRTVEVGTVAWLIGVRRAAAVLRPARGRRPHLVALDLPGRLRAGAVRPGVLPARGAGASRAELRRGLERLEALDLVDVEGVEDRVRKRLRLVPLGQADLGVRAAAVVEADDPAVVVGVAVGADPEGLGQRSGDAEQEPAGAAAVRAPTGPAASPGRRRRRTSAGRRARGPRRERVRTRPRPRSWATWRTCALSSVSSGSSPKE